LVGEARVAHGAGGLLFGLGSEGLASVAAANGKGPKQWVGFVSPKSHRFSRLDGRLCSGLAEIGGNGPAQHHPLLASGPQIRSKSRKAAPIMESKQQQPVSSLRIESSASQPAAQ